MCAFVSCSIRTGVSLRAFLSLQRRREIRQIITRSITPERAVIIRVPSESGTIAARFCRRIGKPFLAEAVGCPWDSLTHHSLRGKVLAPDAWLRMRWCMRHAPYAVYVTNAFLQRRYPTRGISAAVSDVELAPADAAVLARRLEKIRTHSGKLVLGTAAAVNVAFKGQRYVIEALARLKAAGRTDVEYRLAGGGTRLRSGSWRSGWVWPSRSSLRAVCRTMRSSRGSTGWICISSRAYRRGCRVP